MPGSRFIAWLGGLIVLIAAALALMPGVGGAQESGPPNVTMAAYGTLRDDWDPNEAALTPAAVKSAGFGKIFSTKLQGSVYAQPLVYDGTVIATTEDAYAYGINATTGAIEWTHHFGTAFAANTIGCGDLKPYLGSTSTPVIDPATGIVYLTTRVEERPGGLRGAHWKLQAISATTGVEQPHFPVSITGTPVNTPGVPFNESYSQQRPALLLLGGVVYIAFASDCDITPYRGIVAGYSASTGELSTMWSDESGAGTDEDSQAGIWQSGGGLVSAAPNQIILATGNGVSPQPAPSGSPPATLSESVVALTVGAHGQLTPTQFFAPSDAPTLDEDDEDLGSGGPIALPPEYFGTKAIPSLIVQVGKDGRIFLINAKEMGGYRQGSGEGDAVLQTLGPFAGVWGHPAAYGGQGGWVYILESAGGGYLQALSYGVNGQGKPALSVAGQSSESFGYSSGSPLVTSNGTTAGSAVVWVVFNTGSETGELAELRAYAAMPTGGTLPLLWSARIGRGSKFAVPTAYDGRIYVGTRDGHLIAFGPSAPAPVQAAPVELGSTPVGQSSTSTLEVSASRPTTIIGPVTASGEQGVGGPTSGTSSTGAPAETAATRRLATAGPRTVPPSGEGPLAAGVITIQQPALGTAIQAGASLRLRVTFHPRRAGPVVAVAYLRTSSGTRAVTMSGYGTARGLLLSARPLAFGKVRTRAGGKTLTLTFSNSWDRPEALTAVHPPAGPYRVSGLPALGRVLAPRQAVTVSVAFDPVRPGSYRSALRLSAAGRSLEIPLSGVALAGAGRLTPSALHIFFGSVRLGRARTITFTVANTGTVPLTISRAIAPIGPFYTTQPMPEGIVIEPGLRVRQQVTFRPSSPGPVTGSYEFNSNNGQGPVHVIFTGVGVRGGV